MNKYFCINNSVGYSLPHYSVIKGNSYTCVDSILLGFYEVSDENLLKYLGLFNKSNFITVNEWRDLQINSLLDE